MIYLDHAASSPVRPSAKAALLEALDHAGNPAGRHAFGRQAAERVELARAHVAALAGCEPREVVFTAGGTEANNLAVFGVANAIEAQGGPRRAVYSAVEHACVRKPFERLRQRGWDVECLNVTADGLVDETHLQDCLERKPALVSLMAVNNEIGAVQDLARWGPLVRAAGALLHVDAVQALGVYASDAWQASLLTISAHKLGGPQGVGALVLRPGTPWHPVLLGGPHEQGRRPGTLATPAIASFGAAAADALAARETERVRLRGLTTRIADEIQATVPGVRLLGSPAERAPHILAFSVPGASAAGLLEQLDLAGVAVSSGAACNSMKQAPSPVLESLGLTAAEIEGSLRISVGWSTTEQEVAAALARMVPVLTRAASLRPMATMEPPRP